MLMVILVWFSGVCDEVLVKMMFFILLLCSVFVFCFFIIYVRVLIILDLLELLGLMMVVMFGLKCKVVGVVKDLKFFNVRFLRYMRG